MHIECMQLQIMLSAVLVVTFVLPHEFLVSLPVRNTLFV